MSCKLKPLSIIMAMIALIIGLMTMPAIAAENNYRELPVQNNVYSGKANWPIKFTMPIDQQTLNENNIYIVNQVDQTRLGVRFELSTDKKTIYVIPKTPYAVNTTYRLFIETGICSDTNPACYLSQKVVMTFTTIKDNIAVQPAPQISLNTEGETIKGSTDSYIFLLQGKVDQASQVTVNGDKVDINKLSFSKQLQIKPGDNNIEVIAKDSQGRTTKKNISIIYEKTSGDQSTTNITKLDEQTLADLGEVSRGLTKVINKLTVQAEKDVALAIKSNIDKKIANPKFDHTTEISSIKTKYNSLTPQQLEELQNAVLYDVTLQSLMRLAEYFGFK